VPDGPQLADPEPAGPEPASTEPAWTEEEFRAGLQAVRNWGRWGEDDDRGTLNYLTPDRTGAAATLIRDGRVVPLGRPLQPGTGLATEPVLHFMVRTGLDAPERGQASTRDWAGLPLHGPDSTHLDAFSHHSFDGQLYGGRPARAAVTAEGALAGSVAPAADGIAGRGVLLDVPRQLGLPFLPPDHAITVAELEACERAQRVQAGRGDLLLIRTGRGQAPASDAPPGRRPHAGLHPRAAAWLHARQVAVLGSDVDSEVRPSPYPFVNSPLHAFALVAMGLWLLDNAELEPLAAACGELRRWDFLGVIAALRIPRGTASPVNPVAIF
jgi:kynurenine formamidase